MDISNRKLEILKSVVDFYNQTGEPVSSKLISEAFGSISSATIRNEMASLETLGFLHQPHTSAGRIPTYLGYRLYLDHWLHHRHAKPLPNLDLSDVLQVSDWNPAHFLTMASEALAQATGCTSIVTLPSEDSITILGVEFMMMNQKTIVATILFSTADVKNRICRLDCEVESQLLQQFCQSVNEQLKERHTGDITPEFLEHLILSLGCYQLALAPLLNAILDLCQQSNQGQLIIQGKENLFQHQESFSGDLSQLFSALSCQDTVFRLLDFTSNETSVLLGEETNISQLKGSSIITTKYHLGDNISGTISIVGPMHLDYASVIPHIEYFANVIEETLSQPFQDDTL